MIDAILALFVGAVVGAWGFGDAIRTRLQLQAAREGASAAADQLNVALQASLFDPGELASDQARSYLAAVAADLDKIAARP